MLSAPSNLALGDALGSTSLLARQVTAGRRQSLSQPIAKCAIGWRATKDQARSWRAREGSIVGSDRLLESFCAFKVLIPVSGHATWEKFCLQLFSFL